MRMKSHDLDALKTGKGNVENPSYYGMYVNGVLVVSNRALTGH